MSTFTLTREDGSTVRYTDRKRWLWLTSLLYPILPLAGIALWFATRNDLVLLIPLAVTYGVSPLADWLLGEDENNPPEELVPQLDADPYYRWLVIATVPFHFVVLIAGAWFVGTQPLTWWGVIVMALTIGNYSGLGINTGHELGHKKTELERWLAKIVLAVPAYGHFWIEHNRGHHRDVATPEDPASARMGESIYKFARREIPGAFRRAWALERDRLHRKGLSEWSAQNEILQSWLLTAAIQIGLIAAFGWIMIPFLALHNVWAWFQLTSANYIEHYGLLRRKDERGRYERCQPWHSWNSNHVASNLMLFHLERHSDHHAHPTRRYQSLRHFDDLPTLPNGYFGMYLLAYVPPLWFRVMDPRLVEQVDGDLDEVNLDPDRAERLRARYHRPGSGEDAVVAA